MRMRPRPPTTIFMQTSQTRLKSPASAIVSKQSNNPDNNPSYFQQPPAEHPIHTTHHSSASTNRYVSSLA